jgi:putative ABC transport system permease protein
MNVLIRSLAKRPGFAGVIIGTLALGIGANTALFSVAKAVVFTPLPFRNPDAVVHIFEGGPGDRYRPGTEQSFISVRSGTFHDWKAQSTAFERIAATRTKQVMLTGGDRSVVVDGFSVGEGLFELFGVSPLLGRYFSTEDYTADSRVIVLSYRLWQDRYAGDAAIVGRDVLIDNAPHRVIGVMPAGFYPSRWYEPQFWLPLRWDSATKYSRVLWGLIVYGRLKEGVTLAQAQAEMDRVAANIRTAYPADYPATGARTTPMSL